MSGDTKSRRFSESLVLDDSEEGVIVTGITDDAVAAKTGLRAGDEIVAATIHLDHLNKYEVLNILKVLEPYDSNMKVLTKKELGATATPGPLGSGLKGPEILSIDGLSGKGETNGPTHNGDLPGLSLNTPLVDSCTLPPLELTGPDLKVDLDGTHKAPDVSVSTLPKSPNPNTTSASLNIEKPESKTDKLKNNVQKFTMPHFNLPQLKAPKEDLVSGDVDLSSVSENLETPGLNLSAPKLDLKSTVLDLKEPKVDLNGPDVNTDIDVASGKIKWPHLNWKGPKIKGPDLNADLSTHDVKLSTTKIDAPDVDINLPQVDIKGPHLDLQTPNLNNDAPSGKINWPHLKLKKYKFHGSKADLDLDATLNTPDIDLAPKLKSGINNVDINLQNANFTAPDLDVKSLNIDDESSSGKINWPHLKWKMSKLHGPKAALDMDTNLNIPDINPSTPKIEGDINLPTAELNLPKADLRGPDIDVRSPDIDIDAISGKINWPHLKWKKPKLHGSKADFDLNVDLNTPDVDLSVPKTDAEISTSDVHLNLPKAAVDVETPSDKIRFPTLKKPKFLLSGPKVKAPDVEIDADGSNIDLNLPKADIKTPNVDTDGPSTKFKWLTLKKPKWSVSGHKVNSPDVDLEADVSPPDLNLSAPKIDSKIGLADLNLNLPEPDMEGPKLDINAPDIEDPSGKLKWFNLKKPKVDSLKGPKADIDADVKVPDLDLKGPDVDLRGPDVNLSALTIEGGIEAPELNIRMPNADIKVPDVNLNGTDRELDTPDGNLKLPKLKLPKWPKVKGPELDADLKALDNDANLGITNIDAPNVNVKAPDFSLTAPKTENGLNVPDLTLSDAPDVDGTAGKFKIPKIKMPKFGLSGPRVKGPNLEVNADFKGPNLDLSPPTVDANLPKADLKASDVNLNTPDLSLSALKIEDGIASPVLNVDLPKADLKGPTVDLNLPTSDTEASSGKIKMPPLEFPEFNTAEPKSQLPSVKPKTPDAFVPDLEFTTANVKAPYLDISIPTITGDHNLPKANMTGTDVDIDASYPCGKLHAPSLNLSKLNLPGPKVQVPDPDVEHKTDLSDSKANISLLDLDFSTPKIEGPRADLNFPIVDVKEPSLDIPKVDLQVPDLNLKSSDFSLSSPKVNGTLSVPSTDPKFAKADVTLDSKGLPIPTSDIGGHISTPNLNINLPKAEVEGPDSQLKTPEVDLDSQLSDFKLPHFKLPKLGLSSPGVEAHSVHSSIEAEIEALEVNNGTAATDANISATMVDLNVPKLDGDIKEPAVDVKALNVDAVLEKTKLPHFKLPKLSISGTKTKAPEVNTTANHNHSPDGEINLPDPIVSASETETTLNTPEVDITAEGDAEIKHSPKSKLRWPFKWGLKSSSSTEEEESGGDSETDVSNAEVEVPIFKVHKLPRNTIDDIGGIGDTFGLSKLDTDAKDYIVSKGIRLPVVNPSSQAGEKINIMERLKMAKEKLSTTNISLTKAKTDLDVELAAPSLDVSASTEAADYSSARGSKFKVEKPESALGFDGSNVSPSDKNDKLSVSLSNMLGLIIRDSDAD